METKQLEQLFTETKRIISHQEQIEKLKGEKFNVFSILGMERAENKTHSAFLCELLNPGGTHLKGDVFLELFVEMVRKKIENVDPEKKTKLIFDLQSAKAKTEHSIGKRDEINKTGGRIDIYLWDKNGNSICIENKIDADDQDVQIERYYNHNKGKNKVFYLTKFGNPASETSKGNLVEDKDYFILSYKEDITRWLQLCMEKSAEFPLIRENIKQYILLIKKLTRTMSENEEKELFDSILNHYEEASIIASNLQNAVVKLNGSIRDNVFKQLENKLNQNYNLYLGRDIDKRWSQIWIKIKGKEETKLIFGIQSFSFQKDDLADCLCCGIFVMGGYLPEYSTLGDFKKGDYWIDVERYNDFEGYKVCFYDPKTIKKLNSDIDFQNRLVEYIVKEAIIYVEKHFNSVSEFLNDV